jgi:hypothetical protein
MYSDTVLKPHNTLIFKTITTRSNTNETHVSLILWYLHGCFNNCSAELSYLAFNILIPSARIYETNHSSQKEKRTENRTARSEIHAAILVK